MCNLRLNISKDELKARFELNYINKKYEYFFIGAG